jgi:hypothetical protein
MVHNNLQTVNGGSVIQRDKRNILTASPGPDPAFDINNLSKIIGLKKIDYFCSFYFIHLFPTKLLPAKLATFLNFHFRYL